MEHAFTPQPIFGLNPMWASTALLVVVYGALIWDKLNRAIVALLGIGAAILSGLLTQDEATRGIDINTIGLLTGMMILVSISRRSGMFQYVAIWAAKRANANPASPHSEPHSAPPPWCSPAPLRPSRGRCPSLMSRAQILNPQTLNPKP